MSHFQKWPADDGFWGKNGILWATVGSSSSVFLADIILSFVGPSILCPSGQIINFSASVADSFSWNSRWIVHRATHRSTIGREIVMSAWGIWNIPKCTQTDTDRRPKIDRSSTGFLGDFDKSDTDYVKHLPSICRIVANRRTRRNVLNLFHQ